MENKKHKKIIAAALASEIAIGSTGCNRAVVDVKYGLNTAVI